MKKSKLLIMLLVVMLGIVFMSFTASAETFYSGTCGANATWTLNTETGVFTVSGTGDMYDYGTGTIPWMYQRNWIKTVIVEDGITSIGNAAFSILHNSESVSIPSSVTRIGDSAFTSWQGTSITLPSSVTVIGEGAFRYSNITQFTIPVGVTEIDDYAFSGCEELEYIYIPNGVTRIGDNAFSYCRGLKSVTIPSSVTSIECQAFCCCESLQSITIPDSVTNMEDGVFQVCKKLKNVIIGKGLTKISGYTFEECESLGSITIPDNITSIENWAFAYCSALKSVTIPNSVTKIGNYAFDYCESLSTITIPDSVTSIGAYAFCACDSLKSIVIPKSVENIYNYAFKACDNLESATLSYGITRTGAYMFQDCINLKNVTIADSITKIENGTFYGCTSLANITIPESVTKIGSYAFENCSALTQIKLPESLTEFAGTAFNSTGLTSITIPKNVKNISGGTHDFTYCSNLTEILVDEENKSFSSVDGVLLYDGGAYGSGSMAWTYPVGNKRTSYEIPDKVTMIGNFFFSKSIAPLSLTSLIIPTSVRTIGNSWDNCSNLTDIYYKGSETQWNKIQKSHSIPEDVTVHFYYGHVCTTYTEAVTPPTCTEAGYTTYTCECGESYTDNEIPAPGHLGGTATCTEKAVCTECNTPYGEIDENNHTSIVTDKAIDATCTAEGKTEGSHCSVCNKVIKAQQTINKTNHSDSDKNGSCDKCGYNMSTDCSCNCHKGGISGFFFKLLNFFQKLFGQNKFCACGAKH